MSEQQQQQPEQQLTVEQLQEQLAAKDAQLNDVMNQFNAVKSKADELLDEAKKAKNAKREAEMLAAREAEEKARKNGDYEQLLKSSEEQRMSLENQLKELSSRVSTEKVNNEAMKIAAELADGANAEILSEFVARRLKYTDEGLKVLDSSGNLTVSTTEQLKQEFAQANKYSALLRGNKASGGGAAGGGNGVSTNNVMTRAEFESLSHEARSAFMSKKDAKIVN